MIQLIIATEEAQTCTKTFRPNESRKKKKFISEIKLVWPPHALNGFCSVVFVLEVFFCFKPSLSVLMHRRSDVMIYYSLD
jgi:hypothetical protein